MTQNVTPCTYLLDTNILVYAYRNQGQCRARLEVQNPAEVCICAITVAEIEYGIAKSLRPYALSLFLADVKSRYTFSPMSLDAAAQAGQLRALLERQGQPIGAHDLLIAGVALAHNLTVVTRNTSEFERVPNLRIENWFG